MRVNFLLLRLGTLNKTFLYYYRCVLQIDYFFNDFSLLFFIQISQNTNSRVILRRIDLEKKVIKVNFKLITKNKLKIPCCT